MMDSLTNHYILDRITAETKSSISFDGLGSIIFRELSTIMPIERMNIGLISIDDYTFTDVFVTGSHLPHRLAGHKRTLRNTVVEASIAAKGPIFIGGKTQQCILTRFPGLQLTFDTGIRSIMAVSVRSKDKLIGGIILASIRSLAYTAEDLDIVYRISTIVGESIAAMENSA